MKNLAHRELGRPLPSGCLTWAPVIALGLTYAAFYGLLATDGHRPAAAAGLLVAPEDYYGVAALYVGPLCVGLWWIFAAVADRAAGGGRAAATRAALAWTYALPLLFAFLVPDILVYQLAGHAALARWMPLYAPIALVLLVALSVRAVRRVHGVSWGRAGAAVLLAVGAQGIPAALLLR